MRYLLAVLLMIAATVTPALAEKRVALVIGNSNYSLLSPLSNPKNDAALMAGTLRDLGFEVIEGKDADQKTIKRAIRDFGKALRSAGPEAVGLFYYAGHGVQAQGENYLIPLDAPIADEADLEIEAVEASWVLRQMESAGNGLNIVILDACRNNPFAGSFRAAGRGLARMDAPTGSLVAYSAAPGQVAADGRDGNSPYTAALARAMREPGLDLLKVFQSTRIAVQTTTAGAQTPWEEQSLLGDFYFVPPKAAAVPAPEPAPGAPAPTPGFDERAMELAFWQSIKDSHNPADFEAYLAQYPQGTFAGLATVRRDGLKDRPEGTAVAALPPAATPGYEIEEIDETYYALKPANVRSGPGTSFEKVGRLALGGEVGVTGKVKGAKWYRIEHDGGAAYIYAPLLGEQAALATPTKPVTPAAAPKRKTANPITPIPSSEETCFAAPTPGCILHHTLEAARAAHPDWGYLSLSDIAQTRADIGDQAGARTTLTEALETLKRATGTEMSKMGRSFEASTRMGLDIAKAQYELSDVAGAQHTLSSATEIALSAPGESYSSKPSERARLLGRIASIQISASDIAAAKSTINLMRVQIQLMASDKRYYRLPYLAGLLAEMGDARGAYDAVNQILETGNYYRVDGLIEIGRGLVDRGDRAGARAAFTQAIGVAGRSPILLSNVAEAMVYRGFIPEAKILLDTISDPDQKDDVFEAIVNRRLREGDIKEAIISASRMHSSNYTRDWLFRDIAKEQVKAGNIDGALNSVSKIHDQILKDGPLFDIARAQIKAGKIADARATIMRRSGDNKYQLAYIDISAAVRKGDHGRAFDLARNHEYGFSILYNAFTEAGDTLAALQAIREIDDPRSRAGALNRILATFGSTAGPTAEKQ